MNTLEVLSNEYPSAKEEGGELHVRNDAGFPYILRVSTNRVSIYEGVGEYPKWVMFVSLGRGCTNFTGVFEALESLGIVK